MAIKVMAAPGPVCFPMIAARDEEFEIVFSKEGKADIVIDSSVSLIKRGLPIDMILLKGLSMVYPDFGKKLILWRKGSANDYVARAIIGRENLGTEIIYTENQQDIMAFLKEGKADSAILPVTAPMKGITLEERAAKSGIYVPGSCSANLDMKYADQFKDAYMKGIESFRKDPEKTAEYVLSRLPNKFSVDFIYESIQKMVPVMKEPEDYSVLKEEILNAKQ